MRGLSVLTAETLSPLANEVRGRAVGLGLEHGEDHGKQARTEACEALLNLLAGVEDFLMAEWLEAHAGGKIGNAGDAQDLKAHVAGDYGFRHRRHAHHGCAEGAEGADFSGSLKAWSRDGNVDAVR